MTEVVLRYNAPVYVHVDVDEERVTKVVVVADQVEPAEGEGPDGEHVAPYAIEDVDEDDFYAAVEIAERAADWPAWEIGS